MEISLQNNTNIQSKAERITAAIFLVSNVIPDSEMLKVKMRQLGLDLVSSALSFQEDNASKSFTVIVRIKQIVSELLSLLTITSVSGIVSQMNASILKAELERFLKEISQLQSSQGLRSNVPEDFFKDTNYSKAVEKDNNPVPDTYTPKTVYPPNHSQEKERSNRKDQRSKAILAVIAKRGEVSIKDISFSVKGCSEKTVQRELNALIASGVVKKTGERRWSRYSLS